MKPMPIKSYFVVLLSLFLLGCTSMRSVHFAAIGDTPYEANEKQLTSLQQTFKEISANNIPFLIHVGDIFKGWDGCEADKYALRARLFKQIPMPLLITIGDNEYNDCVDPMLAQRHFRDIILGNPPFEGKVSGADPKYAAIAITRQASQIENAVWSHKNVLFIMLVLPDLPGNYPLTDLEIDDMLESNTTFLKQHLAHASASKHDAAVVITHSEPELCNVDACEKFKLGLKQTLKNFSKPVLFIHGSDHSSNYIANNYLNVRNWARLRPGSEPDVMWPEIVFLPEQSKFTIIWHDGPWLRKDRQQK